MGKSSKKNEGHETDLRQRADEAIATWRTAREHAKGEFEKHQKLTCAPTTLRRNTWEESARERDALVRRYEAEDAATLAGAVASVALDAAERATEDELALSADLGPLHAELTAVLDEEQRLRAALADLASRRGARIAAARAAVASLADRRRGADLPAHVRIPDPTSVGTAEFVEAIAKRIETAATPALNTERLRMARRERDNALLEVELQARREAEEQAEAAQREEWRRHNREAAAKHAATEAAKERARYAAEQKERDEMQAAARARLGLDPAGQPS